jgi:hypothetical protein
MTAPTIQPGTRCECRDPQCPAKFPGDSYPHAHPEVLGDKRCTSANAVRLVTVLNPHVPARDSFGNQYPGIPSKRTFPACEPCATWHESKAGAR